jgi:hypothetical protein
MWLESFPSAGNRGVGPASITYHWTRLVLALSLPALLRTGTSVFYALTFLATSCQHLQIAFVLNLSRMIVKGTALKYLSDHRVTRLYTKPGSSIVINLPSHKYNEINSAHCSATGELESSDAKSLPLHA